MLFCVISFFFHRFWFVPFDLLPNFNMFSVHCFSSSFSFSYCCCCCCWLMWVVSNAVMLFPLQRIFLLFFIGVETISDKMSRKKFFIWIFKRIHWWWGISVFFCLLLCCCWIGERTHKLYRVGSWRDVTIAFRVVFSFCVFVILFFLIFVLIVMERWMDSEGRKYIPIDCIFITFISYIAHWICDRRHMTRCTTVSCMIAVHANRCGCRGMTHMRWMMWW